MKIYLVGGAVRDQLLHLPVKEKDWVVVGATAEDMLQRGFRPVGKDFPVFLHPQTKEEYALARVERKVGRGYTGFDFIASPDVTLEEDLKRRDLTINAMAQTVDGVLIDPYEGRIDLDKKLLRHVSSAFLEDPVRILRVARFAARYACLGFTVAPDTNELMKQMVVSGEIDALVPERVWKELERALAEKHPEVFFQVLDNCNALPVLFPEVDALGLQALKNVVTKTADIQVRFAVLFHHVPEEKVRQLCERYRIPNDCRDLVLLLTRDKNLQHYREIPQLTNAEKLLECLIRLDAFRREDRFKKFLLACEASSTASSSEELWRYYEAAKQVDVKACIAEGFSGDALGKRINQKRIEAIQALIINRKAL